MGDSGLAAETPLTVNQMFTSAVERFGDFTALSWKEGDQQKSLSYRKYYQTCRTAAKSFIKVNFYLQGNPVMHKCNFICKVSNQIKGKWQIIKNDY